MIKEDGTERKGAMPKVSVVVCTYNQEKSIGRTLDSILAQKRDFPIEIIIGDDASTDDTERVCRDYANRFPDVITYVRNRQNKGILHNYYDCLLLAKGEYIADVAGDDFWIDDSKLQSQAAILDAEKDVSLVCTDWKYFIEESQEFKTPWKEGAYPYKDLFEKRGRELTSSLFEKRNPVAVHLCTGMYRKSAFLELYQEDPYAFRNKEFLVEDLQLIILMSTKGRFKFLDRCTLAYSINSESITGTTDFSRVFDLYYGSLILNKYLAEKTGISKEKMMSKYQGFAHHVAMQAFHGYDKERMHKLKTLIKQWRLPIAKKTRIIFAFSSSSLTWAPSRWLWQNLKGISR